MFNRAYSTLKIKAYSEDSRELTGIATTPASDSYKDVVEPEGAEFKLPIPLLWQHNHSAPIGHVTHAKVTAEGIEVKAKLVKVDELGKLKDRLDEAWQSIKAGLVRGLSIGFQALEYSRLDSGGFRFMKWRWIELSAVTIPANAEATITAIKAASEAAFGQHRRKPGVSGIAKLNSGDTKMKTIQEQIAAFEAKRASLASALEAIIAKSADAGETLDAEQGEEFESVSAQIKSIDQHITRLRESERMLVTRASRVDSSLPAAGASSSAASSGSSVQGAHFSIPVKAANKKPPGIAFAQFVRCMALGKLYARPAEDFARSFYPDDGRIEALAKAAVPGATTDNSSWAGFLVGDESSVFADFVDFLRPMTILGRFGQGGIPALRQVPFRTALLSQTSGGEGYWVGEGKPKPVTKFDGARTTLEPLKVANIAVASMELLRDSSPSAEAWLRDQLAAALRERLDLDFIDPAKAASVGVSPASILNGVAGIPSSGTDADAVRTDARAVFMSFIAANNPPQSGVWIMPATVALSLSLMQNALGQPEFPGLTMAGGSFLGLPVITSEYVPTDSNGSVVALVNASDIYFADEGGIEVDLSREASLQMLDNPTNDITGSTVATSMVSMFQTNAVAFRAERTLNWARRRAAAVAYLTSVAWSPGS